MKNINTLKNIFFGLLISIIILIPVVSFAQGMFGGGPSAEVVNITNNQINSAVDAVVTDYKATKQNLSSGADLYNKIKKEEGKYKFMVPLGPFSSVISDTTDLTTGTALVDYLRTWFKFLIGIAGIIAVAKLVYLGFQIIVSSDSIDAKSKIKKELKDTVTAFLLVALSWVFLNTLNPALVNSNVLLPKVETNINTVKVVTTSEDVNTPDDEVMSGLGGDGWYMLIRNKTSKLKKRYGPYSTEKICDDAKVKVAAGAIPTHDLIDVPCYHRVGATLAKIEAENRAFLAHYKIYANKGGCATETQTDCTRLEGLPQDILSKLVKLSESCTRANSKCNQSNCTQEKTYQKDMNSCPISITGGTEEGHMSHGRGLKVYDIRYNNIIDNFLKENSTVIAESFQEYNKYLFDGNWYTDEVKAVGGHHFHVCKAESSTVGGACGTYNASKCKNTIKLSNGSFQQNCR